MNTTTSRPSDLSTDELRAYQQTIDEVLAAQKTDSQAGLSEEEARSRLEQYGRNELTAKAPVPVWKKFLAQFQDVLVILLLIATAISAGLWLLEGHSALPYEALAILAVVLLNAILGVVLETQAEEAVAALRKMSSPNATVIRSGARQSILAANIVPGDILVVEAGDTFAADARLLEISSLQTAEASLTGESLPVSKTINVIQEQVGPGDRRNMIFSGTSATYGRGLALVTATGMQTELGRIAEMLEAAPNETTPLQKQMDRVSKYLGILVLVIAVTMIITIVIVEKVRSITALFDVLILGVALAVAAVPEGLPAVVTAVLSIGVQRMAKKKAIVRHLAAVETLGSANIIASDKTGTLTKNEMTVRAVVTASGRVNFSGTGYAPAGELTFSETQGDGALRTELARALTVADRANNSELQEREGNWSIQGDPTEGALLVAARKAGLDSASLQARFPRFQEVPFSSERKLMSTLHTDTQRSETQQSDSIYVFSKGAPDVLLTRCSHEFVSGQTQPLNDERRAALVKANEALAKEALRTLGVAFRLIPANTLNAGAVDESVEADLVFAGLIGMIDPPRPEAKEAVARAKAAGIRPIMITGDHPDTAAVIAAELGICDDCRSVTGVELEKASDEALSLLVKEVSVYARVNPEHKLRIVKALQRNGAIVAMTGDGVNDAPALKTADIGVAMGITGTDVSKEAADIVLADDNFATIVAAVEEGRAIFANIRKFLRFLLSSNIGEVLTMFFGVLFKDLIGLGSSGEGALVMPLLATQILWINLVTDGAPALALGLEPVDPGIMTKSPRPQSEGVLTRRTWIGVFFVGLVMAVGTLLVLDASLPGGLIKGSGSLRYAQTMAFTTLIFFQLFNALNARSEERSAFVGLLTNPWLLGAIFLSMALQVAVIYVPFLQNGFSTVPLTASDWLRCIVVASSVLFIVDLVKWIERSLRR